MPQRCMEIMTIQTNVFRQLIDSLKEFLIDTPIIFDETGLKIFTVDTGHVVVIHLKLEADRFEHYYCEKPFLIGVNMLLFQKVIRHINNNDTLTLYKDENKEIGNNDYLGLKIENAEKNVKSHYKLDLYDLDPEKIHIDPIEYNSVITMPSTDFQKIIKDMASLANEVEIKNVDKTLIFSCKGDFCNQETVLTDNGKGNLVIYNRKLDEITQGVFNLQKLSSFTKCTNLSSTVEINLRNDLPIIIQYDIGSLGKIKLGMSPTCKDEMNDININ